MALTLLSQPGRLWLRTDQGAGGSPTVKPQPKQQVQQEPMLCCVFCRQSITSQKHAIHIQGDFSHTFLNPEGRLFEIGCFKQAESLILLGEPSDEWSWFAGYQWQVLICQRCTNHLGWFYSTKEELDFFGLIMANLI